MLISSCLRVCELRYKDTTIFPSEMPTTADCDWSRVFQNMGGPTLDSRTRTSRVLHYWNNLSHSERNAEKQQYSEEPCSAQMDWKHFYAKCHFFQIRGIEPSPLTQDGENFCKAYWNLDARITAALTNTDRPRGSVNHTAGNRASSSRQPTRQSRAPVSRTVAPRQDGGSDEPPPYTSSQSNRAADRPPPYELPHQERPRQEQQQHEQPSGWIRYLGYLPAASVGGYFIPALPDVARQRPMTSAARQEQRRHEQPSSSDRFLESIQAATQSGSFVPLLPDNVARNERRASPAGQGGSATPDRQSDSRQRSRSTRRSVCQFSNPNSPTLQADQARFPGW